MPIFDENIREQIAMYKDLNVGIAAKLKCDTALSATEFTAYNKTLQHNTAMIRDLELLIRKEARIDEDRAIESERRRRTAERAANCGLTLAEE